METALAENQLIRSHKPVGRLEQKESFVPPPAPPLPPPEWRKSGPRRRILPQHNGPVVPIKTPGPFRNSPKPATAVPPAPPLPPANWRRTRPQRAIPPPPPPPPPHWRKARFQRPVPLVLPAPPRTVRRRASVPRLQPKTPRRVGVPATGYRRPVAITPRRGGRLTYRQPNIRGAPKNHTALKGDRVNLQERYRRRLLKLVNEQRARFKIPPVALDPVLNACARRHNADLAFVQRRLSHTGVDGAKLSERLFRCGYAYRYASENVARGQGDPPHVIRSWMHSPGHRKNLLNPKAQHMGVHVGRGRDGKLYWAQMFGAAR